MNISVFKCLFVAFVFICQLSDAQPTKFGNWMVYNGTVNLPYKLQSTGEIHLRNYNAIGDIQQLLLRGHIGYPIANNNHILSIGYAYIYNEDYIDNSDLKKSSQENRIFEQYLYKFNINKAVFLNRWRLEQRYLAAGQQLRLRSLLSVNYPIGKDKMDPKTWYFCSSNELFLKNTGELFDRNRFAIGLGYVQHKNLKVEISIMNQALSSNNRNQLQIVLINNL
jgi:hypothetical protein